LVFARTHRAPSTVGKLTSWRSNRSAASGRRDACSAPALSFRLSACSPLAVLNSKVFVPR
jgi:hypothetical protein